MSQANSARASLHSKEVLEPCHLSEAGFPDLLEVGPLGMQMDAKEDSGQLMKLLAEFSTEDDMQSARSEPAQMQHTLMHSGFDETVPQCRSGKRGLPAMDETDGAIIQHMQIGDRASEEGQRSSGRCLSPEANSMHQQGPGNPFARASSQYPQVGSGCGLGW